MKAHWRKASLIAVAVSLVSGLVPTLAHAAPPSVTTVVAFGNVRPSDWQPALCPASEPARTACLAKGPDSLFANSQPRGRYQKGLLWITGNATPGAFVDVTVTDGVREVHETYIAAAQDNQDFGIAAGDFLEAGDVPAINVTDLGTHVAGVGGACANGAGASGCDPTSQDPSDWGPSTLTILVKARNGNGSSLDAWKNAGGNYPTITKYAGTPVSAGHTGDKFAPAGARFSYPPHFWCHTSNQGASLSWGGNRDGACGDLADDDMGAAPDISWLIFGCFNPNPITAIDPTGWYHDYWQGYDNPTPLSACDAGAINGGPSGEKAVVASLTDDTSASMGLSSEVQNASIQVDWGSTAHYRGPWTDNVARYGPQAGIARTLRIADFESNYAGPGGVLCSVPETAGSDCGQPYTIKVSWRDAWGNAATSSSTFFVYPW